MIRGKMEQDGKTYTQILSKQEPDQFAKAVSDGKRGLGAKVFVLLTHTPYTGLVEVDEVGSRGKLLTHARVVNDPVWYPVTITSFFYEMPPTSERREN